MHRLATLAVVLALAGCSATAPVVTPPEAQAAGAKAEKTKPKDGDPKPYDEVITEDAVTERGLFAVHTIGDKLFFEIPDSLMSREMLAVSRIAQTPADLSPFINAGSKTAEQVLAWERRGNRVLLRKKSYTSVASDSLAVSQSVRVNNFEPVVMAFDVAALSPDSAGVVIDVTALYTDDVPAITGLPSFLRTQYKVRRLDGKRSFIDEARAFPLNVNVRHTMTYDAAEPPSNAGTGTISMQMFQSMILLPAEPMTPRLADERVGWFTVSQIDFGSEAQKADEKTYIRRWRLEPSDPEAYARGELVTPVKPIVYTLDPGTPEKWRPYFCKGVEDWTRAFEAAGFKDAIRCEMPPASGDSTQFDPEDVRFSTVRYVASETRNATGPSVSDPRSGEIIESDIIWYHNHIRSYRNRLMIETGAANPQARSLEIDEELIGETMRQVIAHEIGHALGLPHNMIASSSFSVEDLRDPAFTSEYGVAPTIMDYTRQNYIAQPGDGVTRFVRKVGPYDDYAINWGYRWYPGITAPEAETARLDALIAEKAGDRMFRFRSSDGVNPDAQTEDMGDDPVAASGYAVANLKRVVPNLIEWTSTPGEGYDDLGEIYGELQGMYSRYMGHVVTVIGGVRVTPKSTDQAGAVYEPVPRAEQERALEFLSANVFTTPDWLMDREILRRIEASGAVDRMRGIQMRTLGGVLNAERLHRLVEREAIDGGEAWPLAEYMDAVREDVWSELAPPRPTIATQRRHLQRGYVETLESLMTEDERRGTDLSQSDIRAAARAELKTVRAQARRARGADAATRAHLDDIADRIDTLLDTDA